MPRKKPDQRDIEVARRMRAVRREKGLSREQLGNALGLTFQQVQEYENGMNRIAAGRLHKIAEILGVPVGTVRSRLFRGRRLLQQDLLAYAQDAGLLAAMKEPQP